MSTENLPTSTAPVAVFLTISALLAAAMWLCLNWVFLAGPVPVGFALGDGFQIFWQASRALLDGDYVTVFDPARFSARIAVETGRDPSYFSPFPYPPHAVWSVAPLAALSYGASLAVWLIGTFAAFAWATRRFFSSTWQCIAVLLTSPASAMNLSSGENGYLSAALMCGGLLLLESRPLLAGILIGALSYKPQFGLLIPLVLIAGGYYRSFLAAAATVLALVLASLLVMGIAPWQTFLTAGIAGQSVFLAHATGLFQTMIPSFVMAARLLALPAWLGYAAQIVAGLAVAAGCCWAVRRPVPHTLKVAIVVVGALVVTPYSFNYDMTVLAAALIMTWRGIHLVDLVIYAFAWLLPILMIVTGLGHVPIAPLVLLALFYVMIRRIASQPATASAAALGIA